MADRIASFLFEHALMLMPAAILLGVAALFLLVRRWPRTLGRRFASALLMAVALAVATLASGLLYAERNIRSILVHRVTTLSLQPRSGKQPARVTLLYLRRRRFSGDALRRDTGAGIVSASRAVRCSLCGR